MRRMLPLWFAGYLLAGFLGTLIFPTFSLVELEEVLVLRLTAAGDVIMHSPIVKSAYQPTSDSYDFRPCFVEIKDYLSAADLAVAVLETPLATTDDRDFSGYPRFIAPPEIADALKWAGIDLVFTAHNHSLDQGIVGLRSTLDYLDHIDLPHTGSRSHPGQREYLVIERQGFRLAFLSYTTSTNGIPLPKEADYALNILDETRLKQTIAKIKALEVDAIILALHTGNEYERMPSKLQQQTARMLVEAGVDIVLGSHVHVIQPYELQTLPVTEGEKRCFVAYSLGNFLSNQQWRYSDCGLLVTLELEKSAGKTGAVIKMVEHLPIWVHRYLDGNRYRYVIKKVSGPDADPSLPLKARQRMNEVWEETEMLFNDWKDKNPQVRVWQIKSVLPRWARH